MSKMHLFIWLIFNPSFSALLPSQELKRESVQAPVFCSSHNSCSVTDSVVHAKPLCFQLRKGNCSSLHSWCLPRSWNWEFVPVFYLSEIPFFCQVGVCNNWCKINPGMVWDGRSDGKNLLAFSFSYSRRLNWICQCWNCLKNGIPGVLPKPRCPAVPWAWSTINTTETPR